ncbi:MAG: hypothetical protein EOR94_09370 [Mesorhizobium sp.]|nr:MAG: hypothetical protein EOR94_09370 [Mesorhizobium sp.]
MLIVEIDGSQHVDPDHDRERDVKLRWLLQSAFL